MKVTGLLFLPKLIDAARVIPRCLVDMLHLRRE
jgi:hypothetical protein